MAEPTGKTFSLKSTRLLAVLLTKQALKNDWSNTEWYGCEFKYLPYEEVDQWSDAYAYCENDSFTMETGDGFNYLLVYKDQDFIAAFETAFLIREDTTLRVSGINIAI